MFMGVLKEQCLSARYYNVVMIRALQSMSPGELELASRLAGVKSSGSDPTAAVQAIVRRVAEVAGCNPADGDVVAREILRRLAHDVGVDAEAAGEGDLERQMFEPLLAQAARLTLPVWRVCATLLALQPRSVRPECAELLERVFSRVCPSDEAMQVLRECVAAVPPSDAMPSGVDAAARVQADSTALAAHPLWVEAALKLTLVLACSDGKFNKEKERYYHAVARRIGVAVEPSQKLRDEVTAAFWSRRARLAPPGTENPAEVRTNSLRAAYDTLESQGAFTLLAAVVCDGAAEAIRRDDKAQKSSWSQRLLGGILGRERKDDSLLQLALFAFIIRAKA